MSSHSRKSQQHLTSTNMAMIERALAKVRLLFDFERHSDDEAQVAAVMVREFQRGNTTEDGLFAVFAGVSEPAVTALRNIQMRKSLDRWDNEGGAIKLAA